jgi:hypothetical protein
VRPFICEFSGVLGTKAAAYAQPEASRVGFFSIHFCRSIRQRLSPALQPGAEALGSPLKKWSAQLSYLATMTEMGRRHKRPITIFLALPFGPKANCQARAISCKLSVQVK